MHDIYQFIHAESIKELQEATIKFLKGTLNETNSHFGPPKEETTLIRTLLIIINELGCITTDSQPGLIKDDYHQRAYVTMLIQKERYDVFKERMGENVHVKRLSEELEGDEILSEEISDFWSKNRYWVSAYFDKKGDFSGKTHLGVCEEINCASFEDIEIYQELEENYYEIEVVDLEWGRKDLLFRDIIKVLLDFS